jgi:hypothetical protein
MNGLDRRKTLCLAAGAVAILLVAATRPVVHVARTAVREREFAKLTPAWGPTGVEDISRLDRTRVRAAVTLPREETAAIETLRGLLREARERRSSISIAGARHSMGGQTFAPDGVVVDMLPLRSMCFDDQRKLLHVQAGARWEDVIPFLGARGLSVSVMQSDSPFTVGGSLSVNCHGWQNDRPPLASTATRYTTSGSFTSTMMPRASELPPTTAVTGRGSARRVACRSVASARYRANAATYPLYDSMGITTVPAPKSAPVRSNKSLESFYVLPGALPSQTLGYRRPGAHRRSIQAFRLSVPTTVWIARAPCA